MIYQNSTTFFICSKQQDMLQFQNSEKQKKQNGTNSQKSIFNQIIRNHQSKEHSLKILCTKDRISTYFQFYHILMKQKFHSFHPNQVPGFQQTEINVNYDHFSLKNFQSLEKLRNQENKASEQLNQKTLKFLSSYQSFHRENLQNKLLKSGRFKKVDTFTSQIFINEIYPSKNYQIVKLDIQILWYKTQIIILNDSEKNSITSNCFVSDSGSYGQIYLLKILKQEIAVKSIKLLKQQIHDDHQYQKLNSKILMNTMKEYFFLLLFSELKIGPKTKNIGGFDLILEPDCIKFATEICQVPKIQNEEIFFLEIGQNLLEMHLLQITHGDIKRLNIMYSPTFQKHIFIDFGCTNGLKETLGMKKITKFMGTTSYCSQEMLEIFLKTGPVDLYYNDIVGLSRSLDLQYYKNTLDQSKINEGKDEIILIYQMKFDIYKGNYKNFYIAWNHIRNHHFDDQEEIQVKLLNFFKELRISQQIRHFYWNEINQKVQQIPQQRKLKSLMKSQSFDILSEIINFPQKQLIFKPTQKLYQMLKTSQKNLTYEQKQIESILASKQKIRDYLKEMLRQHKNKQTFQLDMFQTTKLSLIIACYSNFAQNKYHSSIDDKIKVCQFGINVIEKIIVNQEKFYEIFFSCKFTRLSPICKFHQMFLFLMWNRIPQRYRDKSALNSLITLLILDYSISLTVVSSILYEYRWSCFISEDNENDITTQETQNITKTKGTQKQIFQKDWKSKLKRINLFWQFQLASILFDNMFFQTQQNQYNDTQINNLRHEVEIKQRQWIWDHQQNQVLRLNKKFYQQLIIHYKHFNETSIDKLLTELENPKLLQLQQKFIEIRKWRLLLQIILFCYVFVFTTNSPVQMILKLRKNMNVKTWYRDNIIFYRIFQFFCTGINSQVQSQLFIKIDEIINFTQLSFRFSINGRLRLSLCQQDWPQVNNICSMITKEFVKQVIQINKRQALLNTIKTIKNFIVNKLRLMPMVTQEFVNILLKFNNFAEIVWETGCNFVKKQSNLQKILKLSNEQQINFRTIEKALNQDKLIQQFLAHLLQLGIIYKKVSFLSNKIKITQKHSQFIQFLLNNREISNFTSQWFNAIKRNQKIRKIIKSNRLLFISFLNFYAQNRSKLKQIQQGQQIITLIFGTINPKDFNSLSHQQISPTFQIAFDYFQIKLIKTNYSLIQCQNMIELFKICVEKNSFSSLFHKNGLIRFIFNSYIYAQKSYEQIRQFLFNLTKLMTLLPKKLEIFYFIEELEDWFWCKCQDCFPRQPKDWNPQSFTQYLYQTINLWDPQQNPYMGLVFFFNMNHKKLRQEVLQKFVKSILRSIKLMKPFAQNYIKSRMHFYVYIGFYSHQRDSIFQQKNANNPQRKLLVPKSQRYLKVHRRFLHNYFILQKNDEFLTNSLEEMTQKGFFKQTYFKDYKYPPLIKEKYRKKLRRFYEVKQNYKKTQLINEIFLTRFTSFYESQEQKKIV